MSLKIDEAMLEVVQLKAAIGDRDKAYNELRKERDAQKAEIAKLQGTMFDFGKKVSPIFSVVYCVIV